MLTCFPDDREKSMSQLTWVHKLNRLITVFISVQELHVHSSNTFGTNTMNRFESQLCLLDNAFIDYDVGAENISLEGKCILYAYI